MQTKNMEKRIEKLEGALTPEQIAKLGMEIMSECLYKDTRQEEIDAELETWIARYMLPRTHSERLEIVFELHRLETCRLFYECAKQSVEKDEFAILYISALIVCFRGARIMEDMKKIVINDIPEQSWEKHFMEFPEDRALLLEGKDVPSSCEDTEEMLIALQRELFKNYKDKINDTELWNLLGYPKPKSVLLENFEEVNAAIDRPPVDLNSERDDENNE